MICNFTHFSIALLWFLPAFSSAQTEPMDLSLEQSLTLLRSENKSLRIAGKEVELAKNEHQKLNAFGIPLSVLRELMCICRTRSRYANP